MARASLAYPQQSSLAERVRSRDPSAEEEFVHVFSNRVAFLARTRVPDRETARDLTQEVMLAAVLAIRDGQLRDAERLAAFVFGTARNVINNHLRTRGRLPREHPIDDDKLVQASLRDPVEDNERSALLQRALAALDSIDRTILWLTLVEGLKPGELGVRLGLTSEVVRTRKSRALKKTIERVRNMSRT
jgi:RNA polymerase sigma factor (sigma-70 family)